MCVNPGWGGQKFIDGSLDRIKAARTLRDRLNPRLDIEIDGGITAETGRQSIANGATVLVAGSFVFSHRERQKGRDPGTTISDYSLVGMCRYIDWMPTRPGPVKRFQIILPPPPKIPVFSPNICTSMRTLSSR